MRKVYGVRCPASMGGPALVCESWDDAYEMAAAMNPQWVHEDASAYGSRIGSYVTEMVCIEEGKHGQAGDACAR